MSDKERKRKKENEREREREREREIKNLSFSWMTNGGQMTPQFTVTHTIKLPQKIPPFFNLCYIIVHV